MSHHDRLTARRLGLIEKNKTWSVFHKDTAKHCLFGNRTILKMLKARHLPQSNLIVSTASKNKQILPAKDSS